MDEISVVYRISVTILYIVIHIRLFTNHYAKSNKFTASNEMMRRKYEKS